MRKVKVALSNIVTAFNPSAIGTRVTDAGAFLEEVVYAIRAHDFRRDRVPGQAVIHLSSQVIRCVSAGVGPKSADPNDYVLREHRGKVGAYLKRELAAKAETVSIVVYTREAYLHDPDVTEDEVRIMDSEVTHVLIAVLANAGPAAPLTPYRFVWNLAGGNHEAGMWSADEIRLKAREIINYDSQWSTVAD
jgi:hypothetical protein